MNFSQDVIVLFQEQKHKLNSHSVYLDQQEIGFKMYQQKFTPYNQIGEVYEEQEYEQEESEPLIQEVDPDYQPTEKQVKEYATEVLGMKLPEDQRLLYLARQGLKAPIPENWTPYQGRDGEVYYKHKITQQKTFEHPTDVEYRKKYTQQKERAARKNLKSMSLKANPLVGFGQPLGQPSAFGPLGSKIGINPLGLSNISSQQEYQTISKQIPKLDPKLEQNLMREVHELEDRLQKQFQQFERQRKSNHEKNMKKYKADFESSLSELKTEKSSLASYQKSLKQEKQRIKQRLKQAYDDRFKDEFAQVQKQQDKKYQQFIDLYQEDNKIKLKKYEADRQKDFSERTKKLQNLQKKHHENKRQKEKQRQNAIIQAKQKYQRQGNEEIEAATRQKFVKQLDKIKDAHKQKIKQFEQKLENEFLQMKRLLGHDPNKALQQLAEKKGRLKKLSEQKLQSMKKKEFQKVMQTFTQNLQKSLKEVESSLEIQHNRQIQNHKESLKQKLSTLKSNFQKQIKQKIDRKIEQIYVQAKKSTSDYEKEKNKKILQIRERFISEIVQKSDNKNQQLTIKLGVKEKEEMIQNKEELIQSLTRQIELESFVLKQLRMNKTIATSVNIDAELKKLVSQWGIVYKPQQFLKHQKRYNELRQKYKSDKQLLGSMMNQLQNSAFTPFYHRKSNYDEPANSTSTTSLLTKQYNKDVRTIRKNQQMLNKYELTLRKAQLNDESALKELQDLEFNYEQISLRVGNRSQLNDPNEPQLQQIGNSDLILKDNNKYPSECYTSFQSVEERLQQHSKFLSNVKAQLNRKLYKVRNNHFRV